MDAARMRALALTARVGRLATVDAGGRPHVVPVCFALDGERIVSAVDAKPKSSLDLRRLDNVRSRGIAALLVDHWSEDWAELWWVRVRGPARVLAAGSGPADEAIDILVDKYGQYRRDRPPGPVIEIAAVEWRGWAPSG